jgi:hypothetical protein
VTADPGNIASIQDAGQPISTVSPPPLSSPSRKAYKFYCLSIALVPVIAVVASFFIARSFWYIRHQKNSYLAISDYPFTLQNTHCEVIIYGDSSALTGLSPQVIRTATALRTCNIAQPNTALAIAGAFALDSYLQNNARPKFLIFQFAAPDFSPMNSNGRLYEEGALQLIRHRLDLQTFKLFARHPMQALEFSEFILRTALFEKDWTGGTYDRSWAEIQATQGLFTAPRPPLVHCLGDLEEKSPDPLWIQGLRKRYSVGGTRVLVYVAPQPECDNSYDYYAKKIAPLADNRLQRFSIRMFNEKNHFTREGAALNSVHVAADIARMLGE